MLPMFAYVRPRSLDDALKQLAGPGARVHAGGTDLMGCLRDRVFTVSKVVSLAQLDDLRGIAATREGGLRIGALTTLADIERDSDVRAQYMALAQAAAVVASPQLRNQGTLGGNLCQRPRCWYFRGDYACLRKGGDLCYAMEGRNQYHAIFGGNGCFIVHPSDTAPALIALEAQVGIAGPQGRRTVPLDTFFVAPEQDVQKETILQTGEIVTEVTLPPAVPGLRSSYRKVRARGSWDFALTGLALAIGMKGDRVARARVVFSGVAPIPWRSVAAERALIGQTLDAKTIGRVADVAVAGADPLESNGYKVMLARGVIEEALGKLVG